MTLARTPEPLNPDFTFGEDADMVRQTAHEFVRRDLLPQEPKLLNSKDPAEQKEIADTATDSLKEMGLYSAGVPEELGGGGLGLIETCLIAEELAHTIIPVQWGELTPVLYECGESQRNQFLKPVVEGSRHYALAFREPEFSNTSLHMATVAGALDSCYRLNGVKLLSRRDFDFCLVFAQAEDGPTCFIVERDSPGVEIRMPEDKLSAAEMVLRDCAVPADRILGQAGKAFQLGRKWFAPARVARAAAILGACDRLLEVDAQYFHDWTQMGQHISDRKAMQQPLAEIAGDVEALRWLVYHAGWLAAEGRKVEYDSMLVKLQAGRVLTDTVNRSVRIHGGTMPPIAQWLSRNAGSDDATDMLRLAVTRETMSRLLP
jgi:acyl-CoA dehydrogenase